MKYSTILLTIALSVRLAAAGDLGLTSEQMKSKYGKPDFSMSLGKYSGKEMTGYHFVVGAYPIISTTCKVVEGIVVGTKYEASSEVPFTPTEISKFLDVAGPNLSWSIEANKSRNGVYGVRLKSVDGSVGYIVRTPNRMTATYDFGGWLMQQQKYEEERNKLPWYKRLF